MNPFFKTYFLAFVKPSKAFTELLASNYFVRGFYYMLIPTIGSIAKFLNRDNRIYIVPDGIRYLQPLISSYSFSFSAWAQGVPWL